MCSCHLTPNVSEQPQRRLVSPLQIIEQNQPRFSACGADQGFS
jgi:hypothetical protein